MARHKRIAATYAAYLTSANAGDCANIAHVLKMAKYYTGSEGQYSHSMATHKAQLDRTLGPAK